MELLELVSEPLEILFAFSKCSSTFFRSSLSAEETGEEIDSFLDAFVESWKWDLLSIDFQRLILIVNDSKDLDGGLAKMSDFQEGMSMGALGLAAFTDIEVRADHTFVPDADNGAGVALITSNMSMDNLRVGFNLRLDFLHSLAGASDLALSHDLFFDL